MSFKIKEEHINMFADFMQGHLEFAHGKLSCSNAREEFKKLWSELSNNLNSLGYGVRTVEKWQRTWSDYKLNLKKRASELKKEQNQTGGGPSTTKKLCETDCRILSILGKTFYEGCGVEEQGFARLQRKETPCVKIRNSQNASNTKISEGKIIITEATNSNISLPSTSSNDQLKRKITDDHDYLASPRFPKKLKKRGLINENQTINTYYEETIQLLRNIDQNTKTMNETFKDINNNFSELCDILKKK